MIIGSFHYDDEIDTFVGEVSFIDYQIHIVPNKKSGDSEPDYRLVAKGVHGDLEYGAAWKRVGERSGQEFVSVSIDSPTLAAPVNTALFLGEDGKTATLVWRRKERKEPRVAEPQTPPAPTAAKSKKKAA